MFFSVGAWANPPQTPTKLVITTQPVLGTNGRLLSVQPVVEIRYDNNLLVSSSNAEVIAEISDGLGGTLGGTRKVTAVNGVATSTDLTFTGAKATALPICSLQHRHSTVCCWPIKMEKSATLIQYPLAVQ